MTAPIILITGIMASGKSTVAQALAEQFPRSVHVRGDMFRRLIVNGQAVMNDVSLSEEAIDQLRLRQELAADAAARYAQAGFTVILQDIYIEHDLEAMVNRLRDHALYVVVLFPSVESVAKRDADRQALRSKFAYREGGLTPDVMDTILREKTPRIGLWLDSSDLTVEQTVLEIVSRLEEARVSS